MDSIELLAKEYPNLILKDDIDFGKKYSTSNIKYDLENLDYFSNRALGID